MNAVYQDVRRIASRHARCVWLDGAGGRDWSGRRSILAWLEPSDVSLTYDATLQEVWRHSDGISRLIGADPFVALGDELSRGSSGDRWFGYFGYAARTDLPACVGGPVPDAIWMRPSRTRTVAHAATPRTRDYACPATSAVNLPALPTVVPAAYRRAFARVQQHLHSGDTYELNLTFRQDVLSERDPLSTYARLRSLNPAPYAGFLQHDVERARGWLLASSPERFAAVTADGLIQAKPMKGTVPRGHSPAEDDRMRQMLRTEQKFISENLMITDLLRNDLGMVCDPGTIEVPTLMGVETYENVHQLVSTVQGRLRRDISSLDALRAIFPAGSMTGAPKVRTMQLIAEVEETARSVYSGAFGWIDAGGAADLGVIIRSLYTAGDGRWTLGTGGGITAQSELDEEYAEALLKAERLHAALS